MGLRIEVLDPARIKKTNFLMITKVNVRIREKYIALKVSRCECLHVLLVCMHILVIIFIVLLLIIGPYTTFIEVHTN